MRACPSCLAVYSTDAEFCGLDGERLIEAPPDPLAGKIVGRYRLEELIGTGASGLVYRATTLDEGQEVAIKLLYGEMACDRRVVARFRREAETSSKLRHPNIVTVSDFAVAQSGLAYLVMELIDGTSLDQAIEREAPFLPERAARIAEQISAGLAEAHRQGFVHRDLKPGNVMLTTNATLERVKILDFGIVGTMRTERGESRLTKTGYVVGTPAYMAPEQIDESIELGPPADVYALGTILYEMLAGYPPFGGTVEQILVKKLTREPDPLPEHGEIGRLAMSLLRRDPRERPPTALHVSAEIHRLSLLTEDPKTLIAQAPWASYAGSDVINAPTLPFVGDSFKNEDRATYATVIRESRELIAPVGSTPSGILSAPLLPPMIGAEPTLDGINETFAAVTVAEHNTKPSSSSAPPLFGEVSALVPSYTVVSSHPTDSNMITGDNTDPGIPPKSRDAASALLQPAATPISSLSSALEVTVADQQVATSPKVSTDELARELEALGDALSSVARRPSTPAAPAGDERRTIFDATAIANLRDETRLGSSPIPTVDPNDTTHGGKTQPGDEGPEWTHSRITYILVGALGFGIGLFAVFTFLSSRDDTELLALPRNTATAQQAAATKTAPPQPVRVDTTQTATQAKTPPPPIEQAPPPVEPTIVPVEPEELEDRSDTKAPHKRRPRPRKKNDRTK